MIRRAAAVALLAAAAPAAPASAGAGAALDHLAAVQGREAREEGAPAPRARALAAWAALAAAAAGEDPAAWPGSGGGLLAAVGPPPRTADPIRPARWALARSAAGRLSGGDARRVRAVLARRASAPPDPLRAAWTLLGLRACGAPADDPAAVALRAHLAATQDPGGGWASGGGTRADTAATGAAVQALVAAGEDVRSPALAGARAWLARTQRPDGGWGPAAGRRSTGIDTAWGLMALQALGARPRARPWSRGGGPVARLARLQRPDGGIADVAGGPADPLATRLTVLALRGAALPVAPRGLRPPPDRRPQVVRRAPAPGGAPGARLVVLYRDEAGGTGVDRRGVRLWIGGRDVTASARVTPFSLQIPAARLGALPARARLRLADRAGNVRVLAWRVGGRARPQ